MVAVSKTIEPLLLSARETAKALAVSERTLWTLTNEDDLPCVRFLGSLRYDVADVRAWIASRKTVAPKASI